MIVICLPTRNGAKTIEQSLRSLATQSYRDLSIIVADNASTDATGAIATRIATEYSNIKYVRFDTYANASDNWNRAFDLCPDSEFFMWASDDDIWSHDCVARLISALVADPGAVTAFSNHRTISQDGSILKPSAYSRPIHAWAFPTARVASVLWNGLFTIIYGVVRRSSLRWQPPLINTQFGADLFYCMCVASTGRIVYLSEPLFDKRMGGISQTGTDPSVSHDPAKAWNIAGRERELVGMLGLGRLGTQLIFDWLRLTASRLYPQKSVPLYLIPIKVFLLLKHNRRSLGLRTRLASVFGRA